MIYLLYGQSQQRKDAINDKAKALSLKPIHIYDNDVESTGIENLVSVQTGLFGDTEMYVLHGLARMLDIKNLLDGYGESDNHFIFSENTITKPITKVFEKYDAVIKDFGKEVKIKEQKFNMFSLTDALGSRDKKSLWLLFQEAIKNGSPEEIHGILFWQIKNLALIKSAKSNPGMNPFVYQKTSGYAAKFTDAEIQKMADELVYMFHNRDNYSTLDIELEKFILAL